MKRMIKCNICGCNTTTTLLTIEHPDRFEIAAKIKDENYKRKWVECKNCGAAINIHKLENLEKIKKIESSYYDIDFKGTSIIEKYEKIINLPKEQSDNANRVNRIIDFLNRYLPKNLIEDDKNLKVVDIGAGTGVFLSSFLNNEINKKWVGFAIESDPLACEHLRSLKLMEIIEGNFPNVNLSGCHLCTLNKVLEHIPKPMEFLKNIHPLFTKDCAILYVEVPDIFTINYKENNDNILGSLHYNLYSPKSIAYVLESSGFIPLEIIRFHEPSGKITIACFATQPDFYQSIYNYKNEES